MNTLNFLKKLFLILLGASFAVFLIEASLRMHPALVGREFSNGISSNYRSGPGGIYYGGETCDGIRINLMKPDFRTQMQFNGYTWVHETDHLGFRNPPEHYPADILLIGDSYIYGHGVDFDKTVSNILEELSGKRVYNTARQGDAIFEQHFLLSQYIDVISPKFILYFYYVNDISDLYFNLDLIGIPLNEADAYFTSAIQKPVPINSDCGQNIYGSQVAFDNHDTSFFERLTRKPYLLRIPDFYNQRNQANGVMREVKDIVDDETSSAWVFQKHKLRLMDELSREHGARFVIAPVTPLSSLHHDILKRFSKINGIPFIETYPSLNRQDHAEYYLPEDGHFTEAGARRMAEILDTYLQSVPDLD